MKRFFIYLRSRLKVIVLIALIVIVQFVVFFLYSVPFDAIIYAYELLTFVFVISIIWDYLSFYRKHKALRDKIQCEKTYQFELFETNNQLEKDYHELIMKLISEKYQIAEEKVSAMTDLKDYYAIWAHQIKTPIAAMDMLLQTQNDMDKQDVSELKGQLFKIDFYVDAVMNYLRLEDLSSDYAFKACSVEKIVHKSVKKFAPWFIGKKITIELNNLNCTVTSDEKWLGFIVEQLLSNAVKYTPEGGKIKIYMDADEKKGGRQILVVKDNGIGIEPEDLPRIFERGYTGYNGRMTKKSSGIGLYLCRKASKKLGNTIEIESEPGKGTKVLIDLTQRITGND